MLAATATTPSPSNGGTHSPPTAAVKMDGFRTMDDVVGVDALSTSTKFLPFTAWGKFLLVFSLTTAILDVFSDAWVAYNYSQQGEWVYFSLTLMFILVPSLIVTWISLRWSLIQKRQSEYDPYRLRMRLAVVLHVFQLAIVYRYLSALIFGCKSQDKSRKETDRRVYYQLMLWEDNDASILRLVESFVESVPQVLLQAYVLITTPDQEHSVVLMQVVSIVIGVVSAAWSLVAYIRTLRLSLDDSPKISKRGTVISYCWRLLVLVPRLTALALFSSVFRWWTLLVCGIRWLLMYGWLIKFFPMRHYKDRHEELWFKAVLAFIYISCFIDLAPGKRRLRYTIFYTFTFCENALLLGMWYHYKQGSPWYETLALLGSFVSFCMGMACLLIYYLLLHPNTSSIVQSIMQDLNMLGGYTSDGSEDSPVDTPKAERRSPPRIRLADVPNGDSSETSPLGSGDSPCSIPVFKETAV